MTLSIEELLLQPPQIHVNGSANFGLIKPVLEFIDNNTFHDLKTIETGAGLSTIVFAQKGCEHICVTPSCNEVERIKKFCFSLGISTDGVQFLIGKSEDVLPTIRGCDFDLALIDGGHGFPIPFIDFFYIARNLKDNGLLILDDTKIWPVHMLTEFLLHDNNWKCESEIPNKAIFLRKKGSGYKSEEWIDQPFVVQETEKIVQRMHREEQFSRLFKHIKKLEIDIILKKVAGRIWHRIHG